MFAPLTSYPKICLCAYYSLYLDIIFFMIYCSNLHQWLKKENFVVLLQHHLLSILKTTVYVNVMLMATFPYATGSHCRQVTIFPENVRFGNMWIITWISKVSRLPMASSTSPFTYEAVEVIFGSIYFYFHIQTAPNLQDCPHSDNLTTFPDFTLS